jgi:hypothetical protein
MSVAGAVYAAVLFLVVIPVGLPVVAELRYHGDVEWGTVWGCAWRIWVVQVICALLVVPVVLL